MERKIEAGRPNVAEPFQQLYLTLISVVQGVALGYMASKLDDRYLSLSTNQWIITVATFVQIIGTWHNYGAGIMVSAWIPTLMDSVIPFTIGATELILIDAVASPVQSWLLAMVILNVGGLFAYVNYSLQTTKSDCPATRSKLFLRTVSSRGSQGILGLLVSWASLWGLAALFGKSQLVSMSLAVLALFLTCLQLGIVAQILQRRLNNLYGLHSNPGNNTGNIDQQRT